MTDSDWEDTMLELGRYDVVSLSPIPGNLVHSMGSQSVQQRKPLGLTMAVDKIDLWLVDIQKQIEDLQRQMTNLR